MKLRSFLAFPLLLSTAACNSAPVESSFCAVVATPPFETEKLAREIDVFAARHALRKHADETGALYSPPDKTFVVQVLAIGPLGAEVAFFPRVAGTYPDISTAFGAFVETQVARNFQVRSCGDVPEYHKSQIYGYDHLAI